MIEISPWLWGEIMILEDIIDIECPICINSVSNPSPETYFIYTMTLVLRWTTAWGRGGGWGEIERV